MMADSDGHELHREQGRKDDDVLAVEKAGRYSLHMETGAGILHSNVVGYWSAQDATDYVADMKRLILECRKRQGYAKLLVDRTVAQVHSQDVTQILAELNAFLAPGDFLAMILSSTLSKMQMGRLTVHENTRAFSSERDARAWLASNGAA
jgi:hypothetical protein